ncbi:MAG: SDR family NAD(P)-dependent oxidoreductase, partial [Bacteroidota bacterium]
MNIIITGASNGIGYSTALTASQKPGTKVLAVSRNKEKLLQLQQDANKNNPASSINILPLDLSDFKEDFFLNDFNKINFDAVDVLINSAGLLINKLF